MNRRALGLLILAAGLACEAEASIVLTFAVKPPEGTKWQSPRAIRITLQPPRWFKSEDLDGGQPKSAWIWDEDRQLNRVIHYQKKDYVEFTELEQRADEAKFLSPARFGT